MGLGSDMDTSDKNEDDEFFDYTSLESDGGEGSDVHGEVLEISTRRHCPIDPNSIKYLFRDETWTQLSNEYEPSPIPFFGDTPGVKSTYPRMPTFLHLFGIFWTRAVLQNNKIFALRPITMHK